MKLIMKLAVATMALVMSAVALTSAATANERYGKQKVVYHINYDGGDADKAYRGALRNIQNHINAVGAENIEIKVQRKATNGCHQFEDTERGIQCLQQHPSWPQDQLRNGSIRSLPG